MSIRKLRHWKQADAGWFREMDNICFPTDISFYNTQNYHWWVIRDGNKPVAYAALRVEKKGDHRIAHFTRCGVLPEARGRGYQAKLIQARLSWCRRQNIRLVKTYTSHDNVKSANNLRAAGFRSRRTKGWLKFRKELS